jgi:hypothetical protein
MKSSTLRTRRTTILSQRNQLFVHATAKLLIRKAMINKAAVIIPLSMIARFFTTSFNAKKNNTAQLSGKIPNNRRNKPCVSGRARAVRIFAGAK